MADYTFDGAVDRITATLDAMRITLAALIGYSMGGRLALALALAHPARWRALVLESSSPGIADPQERAVRCREDERWAARLKTEPIEAVVRAWYTQPLFASLARDAPLLARVVAARATNDPREMARALRGLGPGRQPSLWERLPDLRVPTLLLAGAEDTRYQEITARMRDMCPSARRMIVPGAGHNIHLEHPDAFLEALQACPPQIDKPRNIDC